MKFLMTYDEKERRTDVHVSYEDSELSRVRWTDYEVAMIRDCVENGTVADKIAALERTIRKIEEVQDGA